MVTSVLLQVRLSSADMQMLLEKAKLRGLNKSEFIRTLIHGDNLQQELQAINNKLSKLLEAKDET